MSNIEAFWQKLDRGPAILLLGQDYLRVETGIDPLLAEVRDRFGGQGTHKGYDLLWQGTAHDNGDAALAWMSERCRRFSPPEWLQSVSDFAWNGVISSAIDPIWLSALRNDWRDVAPIYDDEYYPRNPRNRRELHCTFLFGSLSQTESKQRPPLSHFDYLARQQTARNLAQRIPDVLTPLGILAIEAYNCDEDWLPLADLYPILQALGPEQVHYFSADNQTLNNSILAELVRTGKVVTHPESLEWALDRASSLGLIRLGENSEWDSHGRSLTLRSRSIAVPRDLWNRVSGSGTLLDDYVLAQPQPISDEARYWEFRRFLFECGTRPLWSGFARGLAFRREFESQLREVTLSRLGRGAVNNHPIIVHGQTGTGKTVALGSLAYSIASSGAYPTVFIERRTQRPIHPDIDYCCQWFEDHGADATLIVWDGMVASSDYYELQGYLASRGRKAVVVGSSYKLKESGQHLVAVPDQLTKTEAGEFGKFLETLGIDITQRHRDALGARDPSYLVALYRYLPPARPRITTGVVEELERLETELVTAVNHSVTVEQPVTALAQAFLSAGIIDASRLEGLQQQSDVHISSAEVVDLVDIVTVPGRFGLRIPIELLARASGTSDFVNLAQVLRGLDLIHAFEDSSGRIVVGPRHRLEAQLIVQARIGSVHAEAAIVSRIIQAVRPSVWPDESDEMEFVIDLLQEVGPRGDERPRFASTFRDLATAISQLRETRNIRNPRLMLQEAYLLREWVTIESRSGTRPQDAREILEYAQSVLEEAMEMLDAERRHRRLRTIVATELASTFGTATIDSINEGSASVEEVRRDFRRLLEAVRTARRLDFGAYNPVDILAWSTTALARSDMVDDATRTEAIVDALDALETVDHDLLETHNIERLAGRRYEAFTLLGDEALSESAFQSLVAINSAAGYYIRALEISGARGSLVSEHDVDLQKIESAWEYLEGHRSQIAHDSRCVNLLFDYWWLARTHQRLFESERLTLPFNESEWAYTLQLIRDLRALDSYRDLTFALLEAIALFHVDLVAESLQLFREVERQSEILRGLRRIQRFFIAAEPGGAQRVFQGNVRWVDQEGRRGEVFVEQLRRAIPFRPMDFGRPHIRRGESLGDFHIAFNFIGPIADPRTR